MLVHIPEVRLLPSFENIGNEMSSINIMYNVWHVGLSNSLFSRSKQGLFTSSLSNIRLNEKLVKNFLKNYNKKFFFSITIKDIINKTL